VGSNKAFDTMKNGSTSTTNLIKAVRILRGLKQEELAEPAGISRPTLSRLENGVTRRVNGKRAEGKRIDMHNVKNRVFQKCLTKAGLRRIWFVSV